MQVFCAYKADPELASVAPGSFELAEVRVPVAAQKYRVEIVVDGYNRYGCVSVRWDAPNACYTETRVDADGDVYERGTWVTTFSELACVGMCTWDVDEVPEDGLDTADYLAWLDGNVELIEVDGRPFYVNPGRGD